jgi:hypothetical protein
MVERCESCGRSASQVLTDAKALGLHQELQSGIYTCCQISQWADEQWSAWFQATGEDAIPADEMIKPPDFSATEPVLVHVRFRRPQVPWRRNTDDLR